VHDRTLSGDIIVEQNIHAIDICNWVLQDHPVKAAATGGTQGRPTSDTAYSHYNVVLYYPNDIPVTFSSTQFNKGWFDVTERFFGTKGTSQSPYSGPLGIWGDEAWQPEGAAQSTGGGQFSATGKFSDNLAQADPEKKKARRRRRSSKASPVASSTFRPSRGPFRHSLACWRAWRRTRVILSRGTISWDRRKFGSRIST
jgi:hypothetical protein